MTKDKKKNDVVIVAAKRTPLGGLLGALHTVTAPQLAAYSHRACWDGGQLDEVIMGCVLPAGIGQAPARQSARFAYIPDSVGATTINKMCGSGMQAVMLAYNAILAGQAQCILAGGMESMSNAPYLLKKARNGYRLGHHQLLDHLFLDGIEDAYDHQLMGVFADKTAEIFQISRKAQDDFARASMERALQAQEKGYFQAEIVPIEVEIPKSPALLVERDEHPAHAKLEKIAKLSPSFTKEGTVTPANSSAISDGAASLLITTRQYAESQNMPVLAVIKGHASFAQQPEWFTTAPAPAIEKLLKQLDWDVSSVDLFEINEAFAVVAICAMQALKLPHSIVNIHGGACALGHPIGASGARIIVTLLHALKQNNLKRGVAAICIGGGEATALAIEVSHD